MPRPCALVLMFTYDTGDRGLSLRSSNAMCNLRDPATATISRQSKY
jgi:hypothetical protein